MLVHRLRCDAGIILNQNKVNSCLHMFVALMLVECRRRWPNLKQNLVKMKIEPTGRSASKITDVRNPPVLSVKDSLHCIQTTRVICYIRPRPNCLAIHDMMTHILLSQSPMLSPPQCCFKLDPPFTTLAQQLINILYQVHKAQILCV